MEINTDKFTPHNTDEQTLFNDIVAVVEHRLGKKLTHLRFGRQVKTYGSRGVANLHLYTYKRNPDKLELWVNMHGVTSAAQVKEYLERRLTLIKVEYKDSKKPSAYVKTVARILGLGVAPVDFS